MADSHKVKVAFNNHRVTTSPGEFGNFRSRFRSICKNCGWGIYIHQKADWAPLRGLVHNVCTRDPREGYAR